MWVGIQYCGPYFNSLIELVKTVRGIKQGLSSAHVPRAHFKDTCIKPFLSEKGQDLKTFKSGEKSNYFVSFFVKCATFEADKQNGKKNPVVLQSKHGLLMGQAKCILVTDTFVQPDRHKA